MIEIKDLLGKFDKLLGSSKFNKETIRGVISQAIGVEIKSEDIRLENGVVYLNIKPIYKNEILLKKEKIRSVLEIMLGKKAPKDLR